MSKFEGRIREDSRGGWNARAKVIKQDGDQILERVLVGPYVFRSPTHCKRWLRKAAAELMIEDVTIEFEPAVQGAPSLGKRADHFVRPRLRAAE